jgi:hypothetical protein
VAPVDPEAGEPYNGAGQQLAPRIEVRPTQQPRREDGAQRLETLPPEKRSDPLFF